MGITRVGIGISMVIVSFMPQYDHQTKYYFLGSVYRLAYVALSSPFLSGQCFCVRTSRFLIYVFVYFIYFILYIFLCVFCFVLNFDTWDEVLHFHYDILVGSIVIICFHVSI